MDEITIFNRALMLGIWIIAAAEVLEVLAILGMI